MDSSNVSEEACNYVKANRKLLCEQFASIKDYPSTKDPIAYFMAGSPGAGKTEYSKGFIQSLQVKEPTRRIVRIDADEIRDILPGYNHKNAWELQHAASLGVEKILDYVFDHDQDFLLDGTFSSLSVASRNIERCIRHKRKVGLLYLYQDPLKAWKFTKIRESGEGRNIPKDAFIKELFSAKECVQAVKKTYGSKIELYLVEKDFDKGLEKTRFNIDNVDSYLKIAYTQDSLFRALE
jgi:UDP-N-acetylglucosamine kinase